LAQFTEERDDPKRNLLFMQSLLDGLPLETQTYSSYEPSGLQSLAGTLGVGNEITKLLGNDINTLLQELFNMKSSTATTGPALDDADNPID